MYLLYILLLILCPLHPPVLYLVTLCLLWKQDPKYHHVRENMCNIFVVVVIWASQYYFLLSNTHLHNVNSNVKSKIFSSLKLEISFAQSSQYVYVFKNSTLKFILDFSPRIHILENCFFFSPRKCVVFLRDLFSCSVLNLVFFRTYLVPYLPSVPTLLKPYLIFLCLMESTNHLEFCFLLGIFYFYNLGLLQGNEVFVLAVQNQLIQEIKAMTVHEMEVFQKVQFLQVRTVMYEES